MYQVNLTLFFCQLNILHALYYFFFINQSQFYIQIYLIRIFESENKNIKYNSKLP